MAENETIGRATCPVCGAEHQDVKTSKNNLMYIYCENNCRIWFTGRHRKHIAGLKAGISQQVDKVFIKSTKIKEFVENERARIERTTPATTGTNTGINTGRRDTAEFSGLSAGTTGAERKSWLAGIWNDDGDE